jgi:hypothetical protein
MAMATGTHSRTVAFARDAARTSLGVNDKAVAQRNRVR